MATKKKSATKKTAAKAAKKTTVKKAASPAAPKKTASKKTAAKKAAPKKPGATLAGSPVTTVIAQVDIGWGNSLYLRGEGGGLSWEKGILMDCKEGNEWIWSTTSATNGLEFKFLVNDEIWSQGDNLTVEPGGTSISAPSF